jgi:hypothetical protein
VLKGLNWERGLSVVGREGREETLRKVWRRGVRRRKRGEVEGAIVLSLDRGSARVERLVVDDELEVNFAKLETGSRAGSTWRTAAAWDLNCTEFSELHP